MVQGNLCLNQLFYFDTINKALKRGFHRCLAALMLNDIVSFQYFCAVDHEGHQVLVMVRNTLIMDADNPSAHMKELVSGFLPFDESLKVVHSPHSSEVAPYCLIHSEYPLAIT